MLTNLKLMTKIISTMIISLTFLSKEMINMIIFKWANMLIKEFSLAQIVNTTLRKFKIYKEQLDHRAYREKISIHNKYISRIQILNLQEWQVWLNTNRTCFTQIYMNKINSFMIVNTNLKNKDKICNWKKVSLKTVTKSFNNLQSQI